MIRTKRIYEDALPGDGFRILVDRIWPRGLRKDDAGVDLWLKEVAPSTELRRWFGHDPARWEEFQSRYSAELNDRPEALAPLRRITAERSPVTLLYAARDGDHNNAVALKAFLDRTWSSGPDGDRP